jgi:hypothetical protein
VSENILRLTIKRVQSKEDRQVARDFVNRYHSYLNWSDRPTRKLYWLLFQGQTVVGVWALYSAFSRPKAVQEYMHRKGLDFNQVGNNGVFCQQLKYPLANAGSKFLSQLRADAVSWWKERYGDDLKAFQTFILPPWTGSVYKADNWSQIGETTAGKTIKTRTLSAEAAAYEENVEKRVFESGEVRYLKREYIETSPKLIFMRSVKR